MAGLRQAEFEVRSQIIWAKPTFVLGRGAYHWQHEPAWFAVRQGRAAPWYGGRAQSTVWEEPNLNPIGGSRTGANTRRWCTNRNWQATVPTTGASSTDGVGSWAAHVGHRIQHIARELRFDRSPTGCPGSKTIADDRLIPEDGVLDSRVLLVA